MKRFWVGRIRKSYRTDDDEIIVYDGPSETYQEALDKAEEILKTQYIRLYVLKAVSYVQHTRVKWTRLDE